MKWNSKSIFSVFALVFALTVAPLSVAFADDDDLELDSFGVLGDSDSEDGAILDLDDSQDSEDVDSEDVDSEDIDSEDSEDIDSDDSDGDLDDIDSEDDSDEDPDDAPDGSDG